MKKIRKISINYSSRGNLVGYPSPRIPENRRVIEYPIPDLETLVMIFKFHESKPNFTSGLEEKYAPNPLLYNHRQISLNF
jgi:hypothetical protein